MRALLAGAIDVAFTGRPLKDEELAKGVTARPFARSPLAFTTLASSGVDGVRLADLPGVYDGTVQSWPDGQPLRLILRPEGEYDTKVVRRMSPAMDAAVTAAYARPGLIEAATDQENLGHLESVPGALGVTTVGQIWPRSAA